MHGLAEDEKEDEWKKVVEEDDRLLPESQLEVECDECFVGFHSRRSFRLSFAQAFTCELDEDIFEAGLLETDVSQFESLLIDPFDQIDECGRGTA
jgi:hypothetical protein